MAELFQYINALYCIRESKFTPFHNKNVTTVTDMAATHKAIISRAYDDGNRTAMLFENELYFTRVIGDVNNNEIKTFLGTNTSWDVIILNKRTDLSLTPVPGYTHIHSVAGTGFAIDRIYLVSRDCMQKIKNNDLTNIITYYYDNTFVDAADTLSQAVQHVTIGKITSISKMLNDQIQYNWEPVVL